MMTQVCETFAVSGAVTAVAMILLWLVATVRRDVSLIDLYWGVGLAVVAWVAVALNSPTTPRAGVAVSLTTAWGLRLSLHLAWRNWGRGEDRRYAAMRARHGDRFTAVSLFTVFLLQAVILWFVSWPVQVAVVARDLDFPTTFDGLGIALWSVGFLFESIGDWQLARFKADPRNHDRVMDRGLWRYTRHPNYFGDVCVWWGLFLLAVVVGGAWTAASPLLMTVLLLRFSGVTLLESTIVERRPEYAAYQMRTNAFFPGPPKPQHVKHP